MLQRTGATLKLQDRPSPLGNDSVLVEVHAAGLCRTDLYVADRTLAAKPGVTLGHEGAGLVRATGPSVTALKEGTLVGIDPRIPCGRCPGCREGAADGPSPPRCHTPAQLGVDVDGVFADYVVVPAACVHPLEEGVSAQRAAYLEPVAAAMGALSAGLSPTDRGVIAGEGRIAELTARIFEYAGHSRPAIVPVLGMDEATRPHTLDFVIDAGLPSDDALAAMARCVRSRGTLVLKSRAASPRSFIPADWVARELTVAARAYGSFEAAAQALADPSLVLDDLFGPSRPLSEATQVFRDARADEGVKQFFHMHPGD